MKRGFPLARIVVVLLVASVCVTAQEREAETNKDFQFRSEIEFSLPLRKNLRLITGAKMRTSQWPERGRGRGEIGVAYSWRVTKFLTFVPRYRFLSSQFFNGRSENENRFAFDTIVSFPLGRFRVTDSNLIERRLRRTGDATRFIQRLRVDYPLSWREGALSLFARDDVYYDGRRRAWTRNRFRAGVNWQVNEQVEAEVFYLRQTDRRSGNFHGVGIDFEISLK